jgi:hypothetical protein
MIFESSRTPLPHDQSFPLKASALDDAFRSRGIDSVRRVKWLKRGRSIHQPFEFPGVASGLQAEYDGLEPHRYQSHPHEPGTVTLTVYSLPSSERPAAEELLIGEGLPQLVAWLERIADRPKTWRDEHHRLSLFFANGKLSVTED